MPNNLHIDYVPFHQHGPQDVQGLAASLFPPTQVADGTTVGPTRNVTLMATLAEMTLTFTPPSWFPLWEIAASFTGSFSSDTAGEGASAQIAVDGVAIDNTIRRADSPTADYLFELALEGISVVPGGTSVTVAVQWASTGPPGPGAAIATANDTQRKLEVVLRPYGAA